MKQIILSGEKKYEENEDWQIEKTKISFYIDESDVVIMQVDDDKKIFTNKKDLKWLMLAIDCS